MDSATILVLVLSAGFIALLAWFEISSRRRQANTEWKSPLAPSDQERLKKKNQAVAEPDIHKSKTA